MQPNDASPNDGLAERYQRALSELNALCGEEFKAVRLIVQHLDAVAHQEPVNTGVPEGEEACSVEGMRLQLRRLVAEERIRHDRGVEHQLRLAMDEVESKWVKRLAPLVAFRHQLSYNDSYFGEPAGLLKHVLAECDRYQPGSARLLRPHNPKEVGQ